MQERQQIDQERAQEDAGERQRGASHRQRRVFGREVAAPAHPSAENQTDRAGAKLAAKSYSSKQRPQ